jgi:hypothetical protein
MEALLIGKGKAKEAPLPSSSSALPDDSTSVPPALDRERSVKLEDPISLKSSGREESALPSRVLERDFSMPASSVTERQPSHRPSYFDNNLNSSSTYNRSATKIKASDLPKFRGDKGEDVDVWIGQLSAIFDANNCSNSDIVAFLSVILKDTALKWFTRLGPKGRSQFLTWAHWQDALRQRFLKANYLAEKKRLWKKRDLRQNEDMADYFDAKVDLQAYVFDENTPDSELILDILDGLPEQMHPILKSAITPTMDLLEFRRILLDYEKGLRWSGPFANRRQVVNTYSDRPNFKSSPALPSKELAKPPGPCTCGGMHWYRDCPKKTSKTNIASSFRSNGSFRSNPNQIPINKSKWPSTPTDRPKSDNYERNKVREVNMNVVQVKENCPEVVDVCLPVQDNEGYTELYGALCGSTSASQVHLQDRHSDKVPTFAMARIGSKEGSFHEVCIDTGSAISLIDSQYLRKNFPQIRVNAASTIMLKGVGNNQTHGWIKADMHFANREGSLTSISSAFHVVTSLATKIIIGNDVLAEEGAVIDLKEGTCSFKTSAGTVSITSLKPKSDLTARPVARLQNVYTIKPGFQAQVPVAITDKPSTSLYLLEPIQLTDDIQIARSVASVDSAHHFAHVSNVGKNIVKLPADVILANVLAVQDSRNDCRDTPS